MASSKKPLLKTVFKAVKSAASGQGLDRVFITGVSLGILTLSGVTGFRELAAARSDPRRFTNQQDIQRMDALESFVVGKEAKGSTKYQ